MIEKRLFTRLKHDTEIKLFLKNKSFAINASVLDISENGISFSSKDWINIKDNQNVEVEFNFEDCRINLNGEIKWVQQAEQIYHYGLFFIFNDKNDYKTKIRGLYEKKNNGYFIFEVTVYLKDINIFGTGYFSRYFDWQGMAREEYFMTVKNYESIISSGIKLITKKAWIEYQNHCTVFDHLIIKIQSKNIKKYSFEMLFTYFHKNTGQLIAEGGQTLVFANHEGKLISIPDAILNVILRHKAL